jgi:hypothetical protein
MNATKLHEFSDDELSAAASVDAKGVSVTLRGSAESAAMKKLNELLTLVHDEALRRKAAEVVVDFRGLEFMNSTCFKSFISWIVQVRALASDTQYKIRFLCDRSKHWQDRSLGALSSFAVGVVLVEG